MLSAYLLPGISLYLNRRKALGILFLFLQPTIIGWVVGAIIAKRNLRRQRRRRRIDHTSQQWQTIAEQPKMHQSTAG